MSFFVSAFITGLNTHPNRNIQQYLEFTDKWLKLDINKIIFIDSIYYDIIYNKQYPKINLIKFDKESLLYYDKINEMTNFKLNTTTPNKDSLSYCILMNNKTEFIRSAINFYHKHLKNDINSNDININDNNNTNNNDNNQFIWIDFALPHMLKILSDIKLKEEFLRLAGTNIAGTNIAGTNIAGTNIAGTNIAGTNFNKVRISQILKNVKNYNISDIIKDSKKENIDLFISLLNKSHLTDIIWYFAGSVFGGSEKALLLWADFNKETCLTIIKEYKTLPWEVNIWFLTYLYHPELIDSYLCDHNQTIITNY